MVEREPSPLIVPDMVLPEVDYLLGSRVGRVAEEAFLRDVSEGALLRQPMTSGDLARAIDILGVYADHDIGLVDASIVAVAERLNIDRVLTLDLRHFRTFRLSGRRSFTLLPADAGAK